MKKLRILHLMKDWLFADGTVSVFKTMPTEDCFVVLKSGDNLLDKVKSTDVTAVQVGSIEYYSLLKSGQWDIVWVFGVDANSANFVRQLDKSIRVVWSPYGIDYVDFSGHWMYGPVTTKLFLKTTPFRRMLKLVSAWTLARLHLIRFMPRWQCRFFRRVNYFSCVIPTEESWLRPLVGKKAKRIDFHYISATSREINYPVVDLSAKRIWVGNSATLTNNHLEVFAKIKQVVKDLNCDVVVPLSYTRDGEGENVVTRAILNTGSQCFGEKFKPIRKLMGLEEYVRHMSSCSVFIFGHRRQQSVGNTLIALKCGGCVFLDPRNPAYQYFLSNGVTVYPISGLRDGVDNVLRKFAPLQLKNIEFTEKLMGYEKLLSEIRNSVDYLQKAIYGETAVVSE